MKRLLFLALAFTLAACSAQAQTITYMSGLAPAGTPSMTDTTFWCTNPAGCGPGVNLSQISFANMVSGLRNQISATPPITFNNSAGVIGLSIDSTLSVIGGQLHVASSGLTIPNASLLNGNGSTLGSVALGTNLSLAGSFPNQTLNVSGGGALPTIANGHVLGNATGAPASAQDTALVGTGIVSVTSSAGTTTINGQTTGVSTQITFQLACAGGGCTPVLSCGTYSQGVLSSFNPGACPSGGANLLTGGSNLLFGGSNLMTN